MGFIGTLQKVGSGGLRKDLKNDVSLNPLPPFKGTGKIQGSAPFLALA